MAPNQHAFQQTSGAWNVEYGIILDAQGVYGGGGTAAGNLGLPRDIPTDSGSPSWVPGEGFSGSKPVCFSSSGAGIVRRRSKGKRLLDSAPDQKMSSCSRVTAACYNRRLSSLRLLPGKLNSPGWDFASLDGKRKNEL